MGRTNLEAAIRFPAGVLAATHEARPVGRTRTRMTDAHLRWFCDTGRAGGNGKEQADDLLLP